MKKNKKEKKQIAATNRQISRIKKKIQERNLEHPDYPGVEIKPNHQFIDSMLDLI